MGGDQQHHRTLIVSVRADNDLVTGGGDAVDDHLLGFAPIETDPQLIARGQSL